MLERTTMHFAARLAIGLLWAGCLTACSSGSSTPQPAAPPSVAKDIALPAPPPAPPPQTAARPEARRRDDLTGRWDFFVRTNSWSTSLTRTEGLPTEYEGDGIRDTSNAAGQAVRLKVGATLANGRLKVWLGPGIVVCEAPFTRRGTMTGQCRVVLATGETGPFRARRIE